LLWIEAAEKRTDDVLTGKTISAREGIDNLLQKIRNIAKLARWSILATPGPLPPFRAGAAKDQGREKILVPANPA
jgi:hypothetical protein